MTTDHRKAEGEPTPRYAFEDPVVLERAARIFRAARARRLAAEADATDPDEAAK